MDYRKDDDHIRELTPGIQTNVEKRMPEIVNPNELLKDEEIWYRSIGK
jgi:hypothetical protein